MFWNTDEALTLHVVYMHASLLGWGKIKVYNLRWVQKPNV